MTLLNAPWAIDGARATSALARTATYAIGGGHSGVVRAYDLKVKPLVVPGNGIRISGGSAIIVNGYQTDPREAYSVTNAGDHIVLPADMPAPVPVTSYYLVCLVVGDPEFNQAGHPFMPPDLLPEDAADFQYVRPVLIPCNANTANFEDLGLNFPGVQLARLEIPPNTTTITDAMIVDRRYMSYARSERLILSQATTDANHIMLPEWRDIALYRPAVAIPIWCTTMFVEIEMTGAAHFNPDFTGRIAVNAGAAGMGPANRFQFEHTGNPSGFQRVNLKASYVANVASLAGQAITLAISGYRESGEGVVRAMQDGGGTHITYDIQFVESTR